MIVEKSGVFEGIKIGRGDLRTWRKPAPLSCVEKLRTNKANIKLDLEEMGCKIVN
jgi:hypothetical protein